MLMMFIFDFSNLGRPDWFRCEGCGVSVHANSRARHSCDEDNIVAYQLSNMEDDWAHFLATPAGRFEVYYAERQAA